MEAFTQHIWVGLAGGMVAFAHCVGMCGGFVLHLSRERNRTMLRHQALWHAGRLSSYLFLGAVAGFTGAFFQLFLLRHAIWQNLLAYAAGAVMFLMGLSLLGLLPVRRKVTDGALQGTLAELARQFFSASSPGAALVMGLATGLLPCPIVVAFIAYSLQTGSVLSGMATMASLWAGTALPLMMLGGAARLTGWHLRRWGAKAGGAILLLLAVGTALRGSSVFHHLLGCPPKPVLHLSGSTGACPLYTGTSHGSGRVE
ncbi:MAG TPA: sulfite exporter TauE/SafE family protein [Geobacter sp.]|nr:sulfite exporter TauE/SafE family protein [Geobacter sp.]